MNRTVLWALMLMILASAFTYSSAQAQEGDEVEQALEAALEAYRAGDFALAQQEVDFAAGLLSQRKAQNLASLLPGPFDGWGMEEDGDTNMTAMAAMFGGGLVAQRIYHGPSGTVELTIMADNPMVASMAALFQNPGLMGAGGTLKRLAGQRAVMSPDGELTAMVANRFLIQVTGDADEADKDAYFSAIDFDGLSAF
ncbi:MAG: hypothetical protein AAFQ88_00570 [Pseudomonadota bacterium]